MKTTDRLIGWFHAHSGPAAATAIEDHHLSKLGDDAKNLRTRVSNPLNTTFSMSAATAMGVNWQTGQITSSGNGRKMANSHLPAPLAEIASGISVAAYGVNAAYGLREITAGLEKKDKKKLFSGITDVTQGIAATMYFVMGNPLFCAPAFGLLATRCINRLADPDKKDMRKDRLNGLADFGAGMTFLSKVAPLPHLGMVALGLGISSIAVIRGLHLVKVGHDAKTPEVEATGIGKIMLGAGLLMLISGLTTAAPAVGVLLGGCALSMAAEMKSLHKPMSYGVKMLDWLVYPAANAAEKAVGMVGEAIQPVLHGVGHLARPLNPILHPLVNGYNNLANAGMTAAWKLLTAINQTPVMRTFEAALGFAGYQISRMIPARRHPGVAPAYRHERVSEHHSGPDDGQE